MAKNRTYEEVVGSHAVELERRMHGARVSFEVWALDTPASAWVVQLRRKGWPTVESRGYTVSAALWGACSAAGLTEGLTPP